MEPVVDRLKSEYAGKVEFRLLDADKEPDANALMQKYGAQYVPTFVLLNSDGSVAKQFVGVVKEADLRAALDALE
jgi:thioredoxin-like negative regulator of GroEL